MFENAELGREVSKDDYRRAVPELRLELVELQRKLRERSEFPVIVVVAGLNCAGRSEVVNLLNEWMDPRFLMTEAYGPPSQDELERPPFWRYWRDLPPAGRIGLFTHAWYAHPMLALFDKTISRGEFSSQLDQAVSFEALLADDGAVILKFWMHLKRRSQKQRLKKLEKDPLQRWRVAPRDWQLWRRYDRYLTIAGETLSRTSTEEAPWAIIEGEDHRYRSLAVGTIIRDALRNRLDGDGDGADAAPVGTGRTANDAVEPAADDPVAAALQPSTERTVLDALDMEQTVSRDDYERELAELQGRVNVLARRARESKLPVVAVFEGWDAAGKGGVVRRLTAAMDARDYRVIPIGAPSDEERAHHYLWRFWRHLGRAGRMTIFDRSWYGRVLVERVEGFASEAEWLRAYDEINDYERHLTEFGTVLLKFWLHITEAEQLARFRAREATPYKRWKLTDEDWRNREKWEQYEQAVRDMVERTSLSTAPWILVEANCKRHARLKVLRTVADALDETLGPAGKKTGKGKREKK